MASSLRVWMVSKSIQLVCTSDLAIVLNTDTHCCCLIVQAIHTHTHTHTSPCPEARYAPSCEHVSEKYFWAHIENGAVSSTVMTAADPRWEHIMTLIWQHWGCPTGLFLLSSKVAYCFQRWNGKSTGLISQNVAFTCCASRVFVLKTLL